MRAIVAAIILMGCNLCTFAQSGFSNLGTEFYTAYMAHVNGVTGNSPSQMNLYLTSDVNTTVSVDVVDGSFSQSY